MASPKADKPRDPSGSFTNCTFTNEANVPLTADECEVVGRIADALAESARALTALATGLRGGPVTLAPLVQIEGR